MTDASFDTPRDAAQAPPTAGTASLNIPPTLNETLFTLCATLTPLPGHAPLLDALRKAGGPEFAPRVSRGGWFRPGRILDAEGGCVAEDALAWLEQAWAGSDEDGEAFLERYADAGYVLTLQQGISHYLVAPWGKGPAEFLQLEIEELQEVSSHVVGAGGATPLAAEDLLERPASAPAPVALGAPRYVLRRLTDITQFVGRLIDQTGKPAPILRFLSDWAASSAGQQRRFCDHWVLALSEHLDRFHQTRYGATTVAAHAPVWTGIPASRGTVLARELHDFDRAAGYGFAWYFHMVGSRRVPRSVAPLIAGDLHDGMAYLPERDAALVLAWARDPYTL